MKLELTQLPTQALTALQSLKRYRVVIFLVFVAGLSGYLVFQINQAVNVQPSASQAVAATKAVPHVDPATVEQLKQLQDNSVSVHALFNDGRSNPFE